FLYSTGSLIFARAPPNRPAWSFSSHLDGKCISILGIPVIRDQSPGRSMMDRRSFVVGTAAVLASGPAPAQEAYPTRAITIISPFPPGGATEVVTRPLAAAMEPLIKQPLVIETKAGAAGQVGAQVVAAAKPDGYTLLSHITSISGFAEVDRLFGRPVK